jgi:transcriptional repressor NrdR
MAGPFVDVENAWPAADGSQPMKNWKTCSQWLSRKTADGSPLIVQKIISGIASACQKRPISVTRIEEFVDAIELHFQELGKKEIDSSEVGEKVINKLKEWDEVAYVRFASVYRQFRDINEFMAELEEILKSKKDSDKK